ncbi:MAG: hypothetical protein ACLUOI_05435 [Eisenbergiella sp.]
MRQHCFSFSVLGIAGYSFKGRSRMQVSSSGGSGKDGGNRGRHGSSRGDAFSDNQEESGLPGEIQACEILSGGGQFTVSGVVKELPESDDHNFYLFELETYEDARGK